MKSGDKVICIDDEGWLIPKVGKSPRKGEVYCIREFTNQFVVSAVSLIGFHPDDFIVRAALGH